MVVRCTTACVISPFHYKSCEFEPRSLQGVLDTAVCDKICQRLATGRCFSPGTLGFYTTKADPSGIKEVLLKVTLNTINLIHTKSEVYLIRNALFHAYRIIHFQYIFIISQFSLNHPLPPPHFS